MTMWVAVVLAATLADRLDDREKSTDPIPSRLNCITIARRVPAVALLPFRDECGSGVMFRSHSRDGGFDLAAVGADVTARVEARVFNGSGNPFIPTTYFVDGEFSWPGGQGRTRLIQTFSSVDNTFTRVPRLPEGSRVPETGCYFGLMRRGRVYQKFCDVADGIFYPEPHLMSLSQNHFYDEVRLGQNTVVDFDDATCNGMYSGRRIAKKCWHNGFKIAPRPAPVKFVDTASWVTGTLSWASAKERSLTTHCSGRVQSIEGLFSESEATLVHRFGFSPAAFEVMVKVGDAKALGSVSGVDEAFEATTNIEERAQVFIAHYNDVLGTVVLEIPTPASSEREFLAYDLVEGALVARTGVSECSLFTFGERSAGSFVDEALRMFENAATVTELAGVPETVLVRGLFDITDAHCGTDGTSTLCKLADMRETIRHATQLMTTPTKQSLVDITGARETQLSVAIPALAAFDGIESAIRENAQAVQSTLSEILEVSSDNAALVNELVTKLSSQVETMSENMKDIHTKWVDARKDVLGFEQKLVAADIALFWGRAKGRLTGVDGLLRNAEVTLNSIIAVQALAESTNFFSSIGSMFSDPFGGFSGANSAANALLNIGLLGDDAKDALREVMDFFPALQAVLVNIENLNGALVAMERAQTKETSGAFLRAYTDFDGGDSAVAENVFTKLEIFADGLCGAGDGSAAALCADLQQMISEARTTVAAGIDDAWAAADEMGHKARSVFEGGRLDAFKQEVLDLPPASSITGDPSEIQRLAGAEQFFVHTTETTYRLTEINQKTQRLQVAMLFCSAQEYNHAGHLSAACRELYTAGKLQSYKDLIALPTSAAGNTRGFQSLVAGIPIAPDLPLLKGESVGYVNVTALLNGEAWTVEIPRNTAWLRKYGWIGALTEADDVSLYVNSLRLFFPTAATGVTAKLTVESQAVQPVVLQGGKRRRFKTQREATVFSHVTCSTAVDNALSFKSPYAFCDAALPNICPSLNSGVEEVNQALRPDAVFPSLYTKFNVTLDHTQAALLSEISRMVVKVEADVVQLVHAGSQQAQAAGSGSGSGSGPVARGAAAASSGCCDNGYMANWRTQNPAACLVCPPGTAPAHGGVLCKPRSIFRIKFVRRQTYLRDDGDNTVSAARSNPSRTNFLWEVKEVAPGSFTFKNVDTQRFLGASRTRCKTSTASSDDIIWQREEEDGHVAFRNAKRNKCCEVSASSDSSIALKSTCPTLQNTRVELEPVTE